MPTNNAIIKKKFLSLLFVCFKFSVRALSDRVSKQPNLGEPNHFKCLLANELITIDFIFLETL